MIDFPQLFKALMALSREQDHFLLAQDAYISLKSCLDQMDRLEEVIADYSETVYKLDCEEGKEEEKQQYAHKILLFTELLEKRPLWKSIISELIVQAECFWYCGPVDISPATHSRKAIENWRVYNEHREEMPAEVKEQVDNFKLQCLGVIYEHFPDLLADLLAQESIDEKAHNSLPTADVKNLFFIPIGCWRDFDTLNNSFHVALSYPLTHFGIADPKFANLLGLSVARIVTVPFMSFIVNSEEANYVVNKIQTERSAQTTQIFYRTVTRTVVAVRWETCSKPIAGHLMARGIEVTKDLEACRGASTTGTEKLLRNWLHSIRNASFQQQAEVIQEEVADIWKKVGKENNMLTEDFKNITNSIKTLIYTSKASVGLIDQALNCQDMMNSTEVLEFVNAISTFATNFAKSEGLENLKGDAFKLFVEGELMVERSNTLEGVVVRGDMTTLKTLIDNIYSNAIRYTDPEQGVLADLHIQVHSKSVQFVLTIQDYGGGLPTHIVRYFQEKVSVQKIIDLREKEEGSIERDLTACGTKSSSVPERKPTRTSERSSLTGIPHIVDIYHELTESGSSDFDMSVIVTSTGTIFTLTFAYDIIVPTRVAQRKGAEEQEEVPLFACPSDRQVLVADDSYVVRRILERYLTTLKVPYQSFADGSYAWEWYQQNHAMCLGVITDLEMPQMGGLTLIHHIKVLTPDKPCYIMSGNDVAVENIPSNVLGAVVKPVNIDQLRQVIAMLIREDNKNQLGGD